MPQNIEATGVVAVLGILIHRYFLGCVFVTSLSAKRSNSVPSGIDHVTTGDGYTPPPNAKNTL